MACLDTIQMYLLFFFFFYSVKRLYYESKLFKTEKVGIKYKTETRTV